MMGAGSEIFQEKIETFKHQTQTFLGLPSPVELPRRTSRGEPQEHFKKISQIHIKG